MDRDQVLNKWKKNVIDDYGIDRFSARNRDMILSSLFELLTEFDVPLEEAEFLKRDVEKFMVTEEGKKNKGKHKGWGNNVEMGFDAALVDHYRQHNKKELVKPREYGVYPLMPKSALITAWAMDKYGDSWNEEINMLCHTHQNQFNIEFQRDVLDSEWAQTGVNIPEWHKKLF